MRPGLILLLLSALVLSACGGNTATPTNTAPPPMTPETPTLEPTLFITSTTSPIEILAQTVTVPVPGTLAVPGGFGFVRDFSYDVINFTQTQVQGSTTLTVLLQSDGTVTRDGVVSQATPEQLQAIARMLGEMNFYSMQGQFTGADAGSSTFSYSLTISGDDGSRTIYAQDNLTPPELMNLFEALQTLGT